MKYAINIIFACACIVVIASCAITPKSAKWQARSNDLLVAQEVKLPERSAEQKEGDPRTFFVGMAMHSASSAFQGDVLDVAALLKGVNPKIATLIFSNQLVESNIDYPFATNENFSRAMDVLAKQDSPQNFAVILLSSHGNPNLVAVNIGRENFPAISADDLKAQLNKVKRIPTLLVISSCHSGTLIPNLRASNRIIITAAADRPSFGCQPSSRNTFFVEELFKNNFSADLSINSLFKQARDRVKRREAKMKLPFSDPQLFVGADMMAVADMPFRRVIEGGDRVSPVAATQKLEAASSF